MKVLKKIKENSINILKGAIIGAGAIAPGISGSSLAFSFGIYHQVIDIISELPKSLIKNFYFIVTLMFGAGLGLFLIAIASKLLLDSGNGLPLYYAFAGLLIGTLPKQVKDIIKKKATKVDLIPFIIALIVSMTLGYLSYKSTNTVDQLSGNFWLLLLYGAILGFGVVLPGLSGATILIMLGVYQLLIEAVAEFSFSILLPTGLGGLLAIIAFAKVVSYFYKKYPLKIDCLILGFLSGAVPFTFLIAGKEEKIKFETSNDIIYFIIAVIVTILASITSYFFSKFEKSAEELEKKEPVSNDSF